MFPMFSSSSGSYTLRSSDGNEDRGDFSLCWNDVDLEQGIISVRAQKTGSVRKVPINNIARRILDFQQ
jgi:hypothetical protein